MSPLISKKQSIIKIVGELKSRVSRFWSKTLVNKHKIKLIHEGSSDALISDKLVLGLSKPVSNAARRIELKRERDRAQDKITRMRHN